VELFNTVMGAVSALFTVLVFIFGSILGKRYLGAKRYVGKEARERYEEMKGNVRTEQEFGPYEYEGRMTVPQFKITPIFFGKGREKGRKMEYRFYDTDETTGKKTTRGWLE